MCGFVCCNRSTVVTPWWKPPLSSPTQFSLIWFHSVSFSAQSSSYLERKFHLGLTENRLMTASLKALLHCWGNHTPSASLQPADTSSQICVMYICACTHSGTTEQTRGSRFNHSLIFNSNKTISISFFCPVCPHFPAAQIKIQFISLRLHYYDKEFPICFYPIHFQ